MRIARSLAVGAFVFASAASSTAAAADIHVAIGGKGDGKVGAPLGTIAAAIAAAQPGDTIVLAPGTYAERLTTVRAGTASAPIRIKSQTRRTAVITQPGNVARIAHAHVVLEGLVLDGQDGAGDILQIETGGSFSTVDDCEIANTRRDCVDMGGPSSVTIARSDIHHCLNATTNGCASPECRVDAHGVVTGPVKDLVIRDTDIHDFSGDAFQADPGRASPGWDGVTIERCKMWLTPLPAARNGFAAGVVPGENAIDTKTPATGRSRLTVRDSVAHGFGGGLISNMAAFNVKERVDALLDRVTVYDSEIAFRLRGPSITVVQNAVVHAVSVGVRYEDDTTPLTLSHVTFGRDVARVLTEASSSGTKITARNILVLGGSLPAGLSGPSNLAVAASAFLDANADDYRLAPGSAAIDKGETIATITADRAGLARVQGKAADIGAHEACDGPCAIAPPPVDGPGAGAPQPEGAIGEGGGEGGQGGEGGGDRAAPAAEGAVDANDGGGCVVSSVSNHRSGGDGVVLLAVAAAVLPVLRRRRERSPSARSRVARSSRDR